MTITPAVRSNAANNGATSSTTITSTFTSNAAGNLIAVGVGWVDSGAITAAVTDSKGNTYNPVRAKTRNATLGFSFQLFYAWGIAVSAGTNTVTATFSSATTFADLHMEEASSSVGAWAADPLDQSAQGTGNSTALATTAVTPAAANSLLVTYGGAGSGTITATSPFTLRGTGVNGIGLADRIQTTATSQAGVLTTSSSDQWGIQLGVFKDAVAVGTPIAVSDTLHLTDALAFTSITAPAAETLHVADSIAVTSTVTLSETLSIADSLTARATLALSDTISIADLLHSPGVPFVPPPRGQKLYVSVGIAFGFTAAQDPLTWVFTDVTRWVKGSKVTLRVGATAQGTQSTPAQINFSLTNRDGRFTARNPFSPYFPNVVKNVPVRVTVTWDGAADTYELLTSFMNGWPIQPNQGLRDVTVPVVATGRLRRLRKNSKKVQSPQRLALTRTAPLAYVPMEDGPNSRTAGSALPGGRPMVIVGDVKLAAVDGPGGSAMLPDFSAGGHAYVTLPTSSSTSYRTELDVKFASIGTGDFAAAMQIIPASGSNTVGLWEIGANANGEGGLYIQWSGDAGASNDFRSTGVNVDDGQWHHLRIDIVNVSGNSKAIVILDDVVAYTWTLVTRTYSRPVRLIIAPPVGGVNISSAGHPIVWAAWAGTIDTYAAFTGYLGELAATRYGRLCKDNGIPYTVYTAADVPSQAMGAQRVATIGSLLDDCAAISNGLHHDGGPYGALVYIDGTYRYNAPAQMVLIWGKRQIGNDFGGTYDDQSLFNEWTISSVGGSSAVYDDAESQAIVTDVYAGEDTLNTANDRQLPALTQWRTHLTSWDGYQFATIPIDLRRSVELVKAMLGLILPARIDPVGMPSPYPPDGMRQFAEGWSATVDSRTWDVVFNTSPYDPWEVGTYDVSKYDSASSSLTAGLAAAAVGSTAALSVTTTNPGDLWTTDPDEWNPAVRGPLYVRIRDAEVAQVTNITGSTSPQTITVLRGTNSVAIAHPAGAPVRVHLAARAAL